MTTIKPFFITQNMPNCIGAVMVDPTQQKIVGFAQDRRDQHPLQHCVMVCIDDVAARQGGGAWSKSGRRILKYRIYPLYLVHPFCAQSGRQKRDGCKKKDMTIS